MIITRQIDNWIIKERKPQGDGPHPLVLLLHGWTGDENSMWIFSSRLPERFWLAAPRGLFSAPEGGYGWIDKRLNTWPHIQEFSPAVEAIFDLLKPSHFPGADLTHLYMIGFSQGAALAYTIALRYPQKVRAMAGLSGFVPKGADALTNGQPLLGMPIFVAHGSKDELVPIALAHWSVSVLQNAGAKVTYCEDHVGHKLSKSCFAGIRSFFLALESQIDVP